MLPAVWIQILKLILLTFNLAIAEIRARFLEMRLNKKSDVRFFSDNSAV